jgi:NAD(P)H-dependent flavin oxidoreductase YrpB (nitropropane dioxygenase family)
VLQQTTLGLLPSQQGAQRKHNPQAFWLAGGYGSAENLREALAAGATGVQVGTAFAFCAESDLLDDYKQALLKKALSGEAKVFTNPSASPTVIHSKSRSWKARFPSQRFTWTDHPSAIWAISAKPSEPQRARLIIAALHSR